jgi:hypothetical protein
MTAFRIRVFLLLAVLTIAECEAKSKGAYKTVDIKVTGSKAAVSRLSELINIERISSLESLKSRISKSRKSARLFQARMEKRAFHRRIVPLKSALKLFKAKLHGTGARVKTAALGSAMIYNVALKQAFTIIAKPSVILVLNSKLEEVFSYKVPSSPLVMSAMWHEVKRVVIFAVDAQNHLRSISLTTGSSIEAKEEKPVLFDEAISGITSFDGNLLVSSGTSHK